MVHVQAKFTVKGECCIAQGLVIFAGNRTAWLCVHQDSGTLHNLRLIGMQHRNIIECSVQWPGSLPRHERYIGCSRLQFHSLNRRDRDAEQDQEWD